MDYIGSKFSLLNFINSVFDKEVSKLGLKVNNVTDIFAGTSAVGKHFKKRGYQVTGNDLQYYSYVLGKHYIENNDKSQLDTNYFDKLNNIEPVQGFIYNNYAAGSGSGRLYFSDHNAMKIDAARQQLENDYDNGLIDKKNYYFYLASIIESIDKVSNTASVYGAFLKNLKKTAQKEVVFSPAEIIESSKNNTMLIGDANDIIKNIRGDVLYLDPPYNSRQYHSNYHLLETIARYDNPEIHGLTGVRSQDDKLKSNYSRKREAEKAFKDLISNADYPLILMSYNNEGIIPLENIVSILEEHGTYIQYKKEYKKFKSQSTQVNDKVFEYVHVLRKK